MAPFSPERMAAVERRVRAVADDLSVPLDWDLSSVKHDTRTNALRIVLAGTHVYPDEESRSMARSALHVALLEEFKPPDLPLLDVRILFPRVPSSAPSCATFEPPRPLAKLASTDIRVEARACWDHIRIMARMLAQTSYTHVADAYPWRDRHAMLESIPHLVEVTDHAVRTTGTDLVLQGVVDRILPPFDGLVRENDRAYILHDVTNSLGVAPRTLLNVYETVYIMVSGGRIVSAQTAAFYDLVFYA